MAQETPTPGAAQPPLSGPVAPGWPAPRLRGTRRHVLLAPAFGALLLIGWWLLAESGAMPRSSSRRRRASRRAGGGWA